MRKDVIRWAPKEVLVSKIKETPNNYKIKSDLGKQRLTQSLSLFGIAGTVVCNTDLSLIDGNSRLEQAKERGEKKIWVSMPNRKLTPAEYKEMAAMYDYAKAGEVDVDRIHSELGTKEDFFAKWNISVPMELLSKMGKGAEVKVSTSKVVDEKEVSTPDIIMVQLFFTEKQEIEFRKIEEKLKLKFKAKSTTDLVLLTFKHALK